MGKYDNINVVVEANNARKGYTQTYETIVLKPNVHDGVNVLTEEMFTKENAKYVIKWNYDLGGASITIPENCIISMEGGSIENGTLNVNGSKILPDYNSLQGNNLTLIGMPSVGTLYWQGGKPTWNNGSKWVEFDGAKAGVYRFGTSDKRPQSSDIYPGFQYYDTTLGFTITWGGLYWFNENGFHAAVVRGELADRPTSELTAVDEGYQYYATDVHKAVYFSYNGGSPKWYYADGTDVQ